jgi:catechol 2,3-dioxygenase-like lactoylglutathione lyase family enzyme
LERWRIAEDEMVTLTEVLDRGIGRVAAPVIQAKQVTHGTFVTRDLTRTLRLLEEVLGMECARLGADRAIARHRRAAESGAYWILDIHEVSEIPHPQNMLNHWGLSVTDRGAVDAAYERIVAAKDEYGLRRVNKPKEAHKSYSFYFQDGDSNWWEIEHRPTESQYSTLVSNGDTFE